MVIKELILKTNKNELNVFEQWCYLDSIGSDDHEAAQISEQGLWIDPNPIPPGEFRKAKKLKNY